MKDCCDAQIFGKQYHTLDCVKGIEQLQMEKEEENQTEVCSCCGKLPCKCEQHNREVDEYLEGSVNFKN